MNFYIHINKKYIVLFVYLKLFKRLTHIKIIIEYNINNQGGSILEDRVYKENLKRTILEMAQEEISNYPSQKAVKKYFESNIDKIINENIKSYLEDTNENKLYSIILKIGSSQENTQSAATVIKSDGLLKSKNELIKFAKYLGIDINIKGSYIQILKRISNSIYLITFCIHPKTSLSFNICPISLLAFFMAFPILSALKSTSLPSRLITYNKIITSNLLKHLYL